MEKPQILPLALASQGNLNAVGGKAVNTEDEDWDF